MTVNKAVIEAHFHINIATSPKPVYYFSFFDSQNPYTSSGINHKHIICNSLMSTALNITSYNSHFFTFKTTNLKTHEERRRVKMPSHAHTDREIYKLNTTLAILATTIHRTNTQLPILYTDLLVAIEERAKLKSPPRSWGARWEHDRQQHIKSLDREIKGLRKAAVRLLERKREDGREFWGLLDMLEECCEDAVVGY